MSLRAVQYGVGPIGALIVETAVEHGYEFVGAVDIDLEKIGEDLGTVVGLDRELGVEVSDDPDGALDENPDIVFHSTTSSIESARPQIEASMSAGADVISTCEELSYPWRDNPDAANAIDSTANEYGQTCLGTGINPGFAMDTLPSVTSTACQRVDRLRVERVQDAATRREPLQEKVGAGASVERFESEIASEAGHVGLPESAAMLAAALGWELESFEEDVEPVVADERVESDYFTAEPGEVVGIHQVGRGTVAGEERITLDLSMYLGAPEPRDRIEIEGVPDVTLTVDGGFHGDVTTPAVAVNSVPSVRTADPGLATMIDVPLPSCSDP